MTDELDELDARLYPRRSVILGLVDDYTLFCYYLNKDIILNQPIESPIRTIKADNQPSFFVYADKLTGDLVFYDHGTGQGGSVFDLVRLLYGYTEDYQACIRIDQDFGLGISGDRDIPANKIITKTRSSKPVSSLKDVVNLEEFTPEGSSYWSKYHITAKTLKEYNVNQVKYVILEYNHQLSYIKPDSLCFSYRIADKHKIYSPLNKEYKFRNNFPREYVEGHYQLINRINNQQQSPILFITKSLKDVMCLRELNLDAIAPKSETTVITGYVLSNILKLYAYTVLLFDNDAGGQAGVSLYSSYNLPAIWIPKEPDVKDTADYMLKYGVDKTKQLIKSLLS